MNELLKTDFCPVGMLALLFFSLVCSGEACLHAIRCPVEKPIRQGIQGFLANTQQGSKALHLISLQG